jgi:hypothetical protein
MGLPRGLAAIGAVAWCCSITPAQAASTTNYTDQWYNGSESGWGAAATQQGDTIFFDVFVYDANRSATWYTAAAIYQAATAQGHLIFGGDLYAANGPYFGGPFNPGNVTNRKVGTLTFDADSVDTATITYSVDGVVVTKTVSRQLWRYENLSGNYYGGLITDYTNCTNPALNGHVEQLNAFNINHLASNAISMAFIDTNGVACKFTASYSQAGHMGTMQGSYSCSNAVSGTFTAFELEKTVSGITGRHVGRNNYCLFSGHIGGILR